MNRIVELPTADYPASAGAAEPGMAARVLPADPLPPTRAARPARSRGAFFQRGGRSRPGRWILSMVCVAATAVSIVASAHFVEPAFNAAAVISNSGPALFASTMQAPSFIVARRR